MSPCACAAPHPLRRIVVTGGPGAGKTAVLELARRVLCPHVCILPEAAGILFRGGFPREAGSTSRRAAQRAIFCVQRQLEATVEPDRTGLVVCDRGTVDGAAYWPGPDDFWSANGTSLEAERQRYDVVLHLRTPRVEQGYNHQNPLRIESADEAARIDERIAALWAGHPRVITIDASDAFMTKALRAVEAIRAEVPACCQTAADA